MKWLRRLLSRRPRRLSAADWEATARHRAETIALLERKLATALEDAADAERRASEALHLYVQEQENRRADVGRLVRRITALQLQLGVSDEPTDPRPAMEVC